MHTQIFFLLDETGSMGAIRDDVIGGFNSFIEEQREAAEDANIELSLVTFNSKETKTRYKTTPVEDVEELDRDSYRPRSTTPLIDAAYTILSEAEERVNRDDPDRVVVVFQTDGKENDSKENTKEDVESLFNEKEEEGWEFVFLGQDLDAWGVSRSIGTRTIKQNTISYSGDDTEKTLGATGQSVSMYASGEEDEINVSDSIEAEDELSV